MLDADVHDPARVDLVVRDLEVVSEVAAAQAILDPVRSKVLAALAEPGSATTVAKAIGEPRQKVNYHLRTLEGLGLLRLVEERPRRGLTERILVASAKSYIVSPSVFGENEAADPSRIDRLSTQYLVAVAARMVREVADLARLAKQAKKPLATLAIDSELRFASANDRARFTEELTAAITSIAARYHDESAKAGRWHRLVVAAHPLPISSPNRATTNNPTPEV